MNSAQPSSPTKQPRAPSPRGAPILGHARAFQRDPLGFLLAAAREHGPVVRLDLGPFVYHLVTSPELVAQVLQDRAKNYVRDTRSSRSIRLLTGESLLTSEGETWRRHRQLAQPIFHHQSLVELSRTMAQAAQEASIRWEAAADAAQPLDLVSEMSRLTFTVVGRSFFGRELGDQATAVESALPTLLAELFHRTQHIATLPLWVPLRRHREFAKARHEIDRVVAELIAARRRSPSVRPDLLSRLLEARDEQGQALSDDELRNQVITFLLAGHETTASLVTWAFTLLAQHPRERTALEQELEAFVMRQESGVIEALPKLRCLQSVLAETLRLYPSIWISERRVVAKDELGGYLIPADSAVILVPYVTHRLEPQWPSPNAFQPARFAEGRPRTLIDDGYFPFGAGPHSCIGQHFALMEAKIILATLAARFRVQLVNASAPTPIADITLRPSSPLPVRIERWR